MDALGTGSERSAAKSDVVMLTHCEHRPARRVGSGDRGEAVVRPCRQVDDDSIDVGKCRLECRLRADGSRLGASSTNEIGKPGRPDQVVGKDGDARGQARPSAR